MEEKPKPTTVAIVGSGMAGLVTAYLLHRDPRRRYEVTVFESGKSLSLDSASVSLPNASRTSTDRVDLPMRAFAGGYYNNLKAMYDYLDVQYHSQSFLFEFARRKSVKGCDPGSYERGYSPYFVHASNMHQMPPLRPATMGRIAYLTEVVYVLACYMWFSFCSFFVAPRATRGGVSETLEEYIRRIWLPEYFATFYLLPLLSSVTTCPHRTLLAFPAVDLTEYKRRTHGAPHYTVSNGVHTVQEKLVNGIRYELSAVVQSVEAESDGVKIRWQSTKDNYDPTVQELHFNRVILAVSPDIVGQIFSPIRRHMSRIPTTTVESIVHTDKTTISTTQPQSRDRSSQLICLRTSTSSPNLTESIHVQPCGAVVTTCPFAPINPSQIIQSSKFTRVLRTPESQAIVNGIFSSDTPQHQHQHSVLGSEEKALPVWRNGDGNVWLVGGWCWDGMVLLEGCVVSAVRIARAFGVEVPWWEEKR
ncbi:FAD/NAD(P)-binding domain-containing protein [Delitschia confertaspora ATCC 74209]|uniref:FAD/NAD(P)-binding domain-containing protein n=1 Tax=Delitschia confertaspora ATCC 74209 TaxID=1513339 RepID=A0A9P4JRP9_9PLEO|nr:FAD/NAD(P)-binding domain-containing protein [Delitschia confertaspora ATCC 74209]